MHGKDAWENTLLRIYFFKIWQSEILLDVFKINDHDTLVAIDSIFMKPTFFRLKSIYMPIFHG